MFINQNYFYVLKLNKYLLKKYIITFIYLLRFEFPSPRPLLVMKFLFRPVPIPPKKSPGCGHVCCCFDKTGLNRLSSKTGLKSLQFYTFPSRTCIASWTATIKKKKNKSMRPLKIHETYKTPCTQVCVVSIKNESDERGTAASGRKVRVWWVRLYFVYAIVRYHY